MPGTQPILTSSQLHRLARVYGLGRQPVLDVGLPIDWCRSRAKPATIRTLTDHHDQPAPGNEAPGEVVELAAALPIASHSCAVVLVRDARLLQEGTAQDLEATVALANLLACLKPRGLLVAVLSDAAKTSHWSRLTEGFPGTARARVLTAGIWGVAWLAWLTGPAVPVPVFEFQVPRQKISRKEWHQLARRRILERQSIVPAA